MIVFYVNKVDATTVTLTETQPANTQAANLILLNAGPVDTFTSLVNALVNQTKASPAVNFHARIQIGS